MPLLSQKECKSQISSKRPLEHVSTLMAMPPPWEELWFSITDKSRLRQHACKTAMSDGNTALISPGISQTKFASVLNPTNFLLQTTLHLSKEMAKKTLATASKRLSQLSQIHHQEAWFGYGFLLGLVLQVQVVTWSIEIKTKSLRERVVSLTATRAWSDQSVKSILSFLFEKRLPIRYSYLNSNFIWH